MRLTSREYGESCLINEKGIIPCGSVCDEHDNCTTCPLQKAINKLADYEDLEEQCIEENQCDLRMLLLKWKEFFDDIVGLYDYRAIGTVSEFRELKEKATAKKPTYQGTHAKCPSCFSFHVYEDYCSKCGQMIDWSEGKE